MSGGQLKTNPGIAFGIAARLTCPPRFNPKSFIRNDNVAFGSMIQRPQPGIFSFHLETDITLSHVYIFLPFNVMIFKMQFKMHLLEPTPVSQSVSGSVIVSDFRDSYSIYQASFRFWRQLQYLPSLRACYIGQTLGYIHYIYKCIYKCIYNYIYNFIYNYL